MKYKILPFIDAVMFQLSIYLFSGQNVETEN